jgi:hypothetical protein
MPKRKAEVPLEEDSNEGAVDRSSTSVTPKKKTKKEKIEEAIAKAKKDMEEDKKKVQRTIQNRLAEGKTVTADMKRPAVVPSTTTPKARKSTKTSKPDTKKTASSPAAAAAKNNVPTTTFAPVPAATIPTVPAASMPPPAQPMSQSALQMQMYQLAMAQAGIYPTPYFQQHALPATGIDPRYQQIFHGGMAQTFPGPGPVPTTTTTTKATKSSAAPVTTKKKTPAAAKTEPESANSAVYSDDEDSIPVSPPFLQQQVSMQVLENVQASLQNRPSPHTRPPQAGLSSPQQAGIAQAEVDAFDPNYEDSDPIDMGPSSSDPPIPIQGPSFVKWLSFVIAAAAILSALMAGEGPALTTLTPPTVQESNDTVRCYLDTEPRYHMQVETTQSDGKPAMNTRRVLIQPCENVGSAQTCPDLGYCTKGLLVRCTHEDFEVDETGTKCHIRPEIHVLVEEWIAVLEAMSVEQLCSDPKSPVPVFDYLRLVEQKSLPFLSTKILQDYFHVEHDDDAKLWLGLSDSHPVTIPTSCRLQHQLKFVFQTVYLWTLSFITALLIGSFKYAWLTFKTYPRESFMASLILGVYYWYTTFKATKRQVIIDTATMRDMALDKLRDASDDSHYVMALRDDVIADLTPYDLTDKKRKYYRTQIWPRVLGQFVGDNRLRQTQHMDATKQQVKVYYQWMASKSATKKKVVRIDVNK